jgi:hypothetical protein
VVQEPEGLPAPWEASHFGFSGSLCRHISKGRTVVESK